LHKGRLLIYSRYLLAFAIFLLGLSHSVGLTVTALILAGFAFISQLALTNTLLQLIVPDNFRGRVLSTYTWALGGFFPIGSLLIGSIGDVVGATNAVLLSAGCSLLIILIGGIYFKEIKDLR
jgi:MFS family permease